MKKISFFLFISFLSVFGQQASNYFPDTLGYVWFYKQTPLDSLNNPVDSLTTIRVDSFAVADTFYSKNTKFILSKTGTEETIFFQPYIDTSYLSFENTNGFQYFKISNFTSMFGNLDSLANDSLFGGLIDFIHLLESFEGWYSLYRFGASTITDYQVFKFDTTITIDTLVLPLRFEVRGRRYNDQNISTEIGSFLCKKFMTTFRISYLISIPPLPTVAVPLLSLRDSIWIAENKWILKQYMPASTLDLSIIDLGSYTLPGRRIDIIPPIEPPVGINDEIWANNFLLFQNYPNPFNPKTKIKFSVPAGVEKYHTSTNSVTGMSLRVFDVLGKEIATLINEEKQPGIYEIEFDGSNLPSGVYFYRLEISNHSSTNKMLLLK